MCKNYRSNYWSIEQSPWRYCTSYHIFITKLWSLKKKKQRNFRIINDSGVQPEIFQGRGDFVKLGHFNKHFIKKSRKKAPKGKILEFFLLDVLKVTLWVVNLPKDGQHQGIFFPKSGHFFWFSKKGRGGLLLSPPSCAPVIITRVNRSFNVNALM